MLVVCTMDPCGGHRFGVNDTMDPCGGRRFGVNEIHVTSGICLVVSSLKFM